MADDAEVCGCNGVCKGTIVKAIKEKGLFTLDDVRKHTKASSLVRLVHRPGRADLMATAGGDYSARAEAEAHVRLHRSHARRKCATRSASSSCCRSREAMRFLEWRTPNGCATCRPALNYYLISTWPHEANDDPQSRFINERAHANIQKDGTFSVMPRMWGGETNASELRRIADVVDKYAIPTVKVTGGQRIDLLGVKKQDLPGGVGATSTCRRATRMRRRCAR